MKRKNTTEHFFDSVSGFYDSMVSFGKALERRTELLKPFVQPWMRTACDLGCGTGLDSIALSVNGLKVTGFDLSSGMIRKAKLNAARAGANIRFHTSKIEDIKPPFYGSFDLALSLGNTLSNLSRMNLIKAIRKIHKLLGSKGVFIAQVLNYKPVMRSGKKIIKITRDKDRFFVRFYDVPGKTMSLNIISFSAISPGNYDAFTTTIHPHTKEDFMSILTNTGFRNIRFYGGLGRSGRSVSSDDLIIVARKAE